MGYPYFAEAVGELLQAYNASHIQSASTYAQMYYLCLHTLNVQLCTRAQADAPSIWAATTNGTLAVISLAPADPAAPQGAIAMVAKKELNLDRAAHQGSINQVAEVFCGPANTSVLISGDIMGVLVVCFIYINVLLRCSNCCLLKLIERC